MKTTSTPNGDKGEKYKIRRMPYIATFVIKMVMMSPNVSRRLHL
jgi:hypothetical protein